MFWKRRKCTSYSEFSGRVIGPADVGVEGDVLRLETVLNRFHEILTLTVNFDPNPIAGIGGSVVVRSRGFDGNEAVQRVTHTTFDISAVARMKEMMGFADRAGVRTTRLEIGDWAFRTAFF